MCDINTIQMDLGCCKSCEPKLIKKLQRFK